MSKKRSRNAGQTLNNEPLSRDMRQSRLNLFILQFEKEAQDRMNELYAKRDDLLAAVDKAYKVELMKIPDSLQKTRIGDLISEAISASEVSIATKNESLEMQQPLRRALSKRVKSTDSSPGQSTPPVQRPSSKASKGGKGTKRSRTLVNSSSAGNLRSVVSAGDLHCSMAGSAAHITVTTAQGQSVCFSDETKADINLDVLDDVAWCQIQRLSVIRIPF
ncbi:borealin-2 [Lycodopsis pacificus]